MAQSRTAQTEDRFYSRSETAELLGVSGATIYQWIQAGKLQARRIGCHYRIAESEIRRLRGDFYGIEESAPLRPIRRAERPARRK